MFVSMDVESVDGIDELRLLECGYAGLRNCGAGPDGTKHERKRGGKWIVEYVLVTRRCVEQ